MNFDRWARQGLALAAGLALAGVAMAGPVAGQGTWETTLQARDINGDGSTDAYYDTVLNITWLADANAGAGSAYDSTIFSTATDGAMTWKDAVDWAANLNVHGTTGWRLPTMIDTGEPGCYLANSGSDCGWNVQTISADGQTVYSELAHLYHVTLGNKSMCDAAGDCSGWNPNPPYMLSNTGPFANFHLGSYWSGVPYAPYPTRLSWVFVVIDGSQSIDQMEGYALAVRPGDVIAAAVPEPQTYALLLLGLSVIAVAARRRRSA